VAYGYGRNNNININRMVVEMRTIKFRGFNPNKKVWHYGSYVKTLDAPQHRIFYDIDGEVDWNSGVLPETVGQFTGLQDKNGVEIYEGDIFLNGESPRVIEFSDGNFHAVNAERTCSILLSFIVNNPRNEIIGTIHTTPELLT